MQVSCIVLFFEEKLLFVREYKNGSYSVMPFIISSTLISLPFLLVISVLGGLLLFGILPGIWFFDGLAVFCLVYFLCLVISECLAMLFIFVFDEITVSIAFYCLVNSFFMIINSHSIKKFNLKSFWYWISFLNYYKYGYEIIVYYNLKPFFFECDTDVKDKCFCFFRRENMDQCRMSGKDVLKYFWMDDINLGLWIFILCFMIVFLKFILYIFLKFSKKYNN